MTRPGKPAEPAAATGTIYKLVDPRDGTIRYIGQTRRTLKRRHKEHTTQNKTPGVWLWVKELGKAGMHPAILAVETDVPVADLDEREREQIRRHLAAKCPLLNHPHAFEADNITGIFKSAAPEAPLPKQPTGYAKWLRARRLRFQTIAFRANLILALAIIVAGVIVGRPWLGAGIGLACALVTPFVSYDNRAIEGGYVRGGLIVGGWITTWTGEALTIACAAINGPSAWYLIGGTLVALACLGRIAAVSGEIDLSKPIEQADLDPQSGRPRAATNTNT